MNTNKLIMIYLSLVLLSCNDNTPLTNESTNTQPITNTNTQTNRQPIADFVITQNNSRSVSFDGSNSFDLDGDQLHFTWYFDNQNPVSTTSAITSDMFDPGVHQVTLEVSDGVDSHRLDKTFTVDFNNNPTAMITHTSDELIVNLTAAISDLDQDNTSIRWQYAGQNISTEPAFSHEFASFGDYIIEVIITDEFNGQTIVNYPITLSAPTTEPSTNIKPIADFNFTVDQTTVTFNNLTTDADNAFDALSFSWNFGDTQTSDEVNPIHNYAPGDYSVTLSVNDGTANVVTSKSLNIQETQMTPTELRVEAESFDQVQGEVEIENSNSTIGYFNGGEYLVFENVDLTDFNTIKINYATVGEASFIEFRLNASDGELLAATPLPQTGGWDTYLEVNTNLLQKVIGNQTIYVVAVEPDADFLANIDFFEFSAQATANPSNASVTIDEVNGLCGIDGAQNNDNLGFIAPGFLNTDNQLGASIVWEVIANQAGGYLADVRFANGGTNDRAGSITVNGLAAQNLSLPNTTAWDQWQETSINLPLQQGINIIEIKSVTNEGLANIDQLVITGDNLVASVDDCPEPDTSGGNPPGTGGVPDEEVIIDDTPGIYPANGATDISPDLLLNITFDNSPSIGNGSVKIYDSSNNNLVDTINTGLVTDKVGSRSLKTNLITRYGNRVIINPNTGKLQYGKSYYVVVDNGLFQGQIGGNNFTGIASSQWGFSTKSSQPTSAVITVDDNAPADFGSLQGALDYIMENHDGNTTAQINIKNGIYPELLHLKNKNNLTVSGESRTNTIVYARNGAGLNSDRYFFLIDGGDLVTLENLTMHNYATRGEGHAQAETLYFNSGGRLIAKNTAWYSEQDTIKTKGYAWFYQSLIAGNVDFIWGSPKVTLFEESEIRSIGDSDSPSSDKGGYVVQSRTPTNGLGYVFLNSMFTRGEGPAGNTPGNGKSALARGAGKTGSYDSVAFINCKMDDHIKSSGFDTGRDLNPSSSSATIGYREFGSTDLDGNAISLANRFSVYLLNQSEVTQFYLNRATIFAQAGMSWNPQP